MQPPADRWGQLCPWTSLHHLRRVDAKTGLSVQDSHSGSLGPAATAGGTGSDDDAATDAITAATAAY